MKETGIRKSDFDFTAGRTDGAHINVEITEATNSRFSVKTIPNKLSEKRSQFPDNNPAILYCLIPSEWHSQTDVQFHLMDVTLKFFKRSSRINAVIYCWDYKVIVDSGVILASVSYPLSHPRPRHRIDLGFIFVDNPELPRSMISLLKKDAEELTAAGHYRPTSFSVWVTNALEKAQTELR